MPSMRRLIALSEGIIATQSALRDEIVRLSALWIKKGRAASALEINSGLCEEFAEAVVKRFGGDSERIYSIDALGLCKGTDHFDHVNNRWLDPPPEAHWDVEMIREMFPRSAPTHGLTWDDILYEIPYHMWIVLDRRHYDAECPGGVDNFFDLPLIQRMMARLAQRKARLARRKKQT